MAALDGHRDTAVMLHGGPAGGGKTATMETMAKSLRGLGFLVADAPQSDSLRVIEALRGTAQAEPKTCDLCRSSGECTGACE